MISLFDNVIPPAPPELDDLKSWEARTGDPVRVQRDYFSKGPSEMSVFTDDENLQLLDDSDAGWWLLKDGRSGQIGYVPSHYVQSMDELAAAMNAFHNMNISADHESTGKAKKMPQKRVSFSEEDTVEHVFERAEYEDVDSLWPSTESLEDADEDEEDDEGTLRGSSFLQSALIDEAVRKALGIKEESKNQPDAIRVQDALKDERMGQMDSFVSSEERADIPPARERRPSLLSRLLSPLLRSQEEKGMESAPGMVKVFAGNFSPIPEAYKTCIMSDDSSMLELEAVAKRLFRISDTDEDYELTLVHDQSQHVLPVQGSFTLGTLTEIAKVATIEDGLMKDKKGKPVSRHRKKVPRSHLLLIRKRKQSLSLKGIKTGFLVDPLLPRHKSSDFPTHYRFILNTKIAPYIRHHFYIWVELVNGSAKEQAASRIALAVKALTTVDEIIERSLQSMDITPMPGVSHDLVLDLQPSYIHQFRFSPKGQHEAIPRELTINDIRSQWSHVDSSGFLFLLRPYVSIGSQPFDTKPSI